MDKRSFLIRLLYKLESERKPAKWIRLIVQNEFLDNHKIDKIIQLINNTISEIKDSKLKDKLVKSVNYLEKLKQKEKEERERENQELEELLDQI